MTSTSPSAASPPPVALPRKKRRIFLWFFLAVQVFFIVWIIVGTASGGRTEPTVAQMAQYCGHGPNSVLALYKSKADCTAHYSRVLSDAVGAGRGIGVALVVIVWIVVDFLLGLVYGIYRLAKRV